MSATWTSRLPEFRRLDERAQKAALLTVALVYERAMKDRLEQGYTTGAFVTGRLAESVDHSEPFLIGPAAWAIRIGSDVALALAWEGGHFNIYTQRYERVETWRPIIVEQRQRIAREFARSYTAMMARSA
jgi:hypothetical protein